MMFLVREEKEEEKVGRNECSIITTQEYDFSSTYCFSSYLSGCSFSVSSARNSSSPQPRNAKVTPFQAIKLDLLTSSNLRALKAIHALITPRCVLIYSGPFSTPRQTCASTCLLNISIWMSVGNSKLTCPITCFRS